MFFQHPNQYTLLVLGMQAFQAQSQSDPLSYYHIAGIHGVPKADWDGVGACSSCSSADGYCTHDSVLFPPWHRTYVALFEMQFVAAVNTVAASYPAGSQRTAMQGAASTIRFPFWDWAAQPNPGYPTFANLISQKFVTVTGPTGSQTIINPLFRHDFTSSADLFYYPYNNWPVTYRYPSTDNSPSLSQESQATSAFDSIRSSLQDQVYQLFATCTDYLHFSNDDAGSSSTSCSNSLEGIHKPPIYLSKRHEDPELDARAIAPLLATNGSSFQYVANIQSARYALNGSYSIYVFMQNPPSEEPTTWATAPNLIGSQGILAQPGMTMNHVIVAGSIPLTRALTAQVTSGALDNLTEAATVPFLSANMMWRVMGPDGGSLHPSTVPDFLVTVVGSTAAPPASPGDFPVYSQFFNLTMATQGKAGGANSTAPG